MNRTYTPAQPQKMPFGLFLILLVGAAIYSSTQYQIGQAQPYVYATTAGGLTFSYEVTATDVTVDWSGGGDFDPRDKCPDDFFGAGFTVICKRLADGTCVKFLHHKGKQLLYRIDKDIINQKVKFGLHWVTGTRFNAKYRIADSAYKGGKSVGVPNPKGETDLIRFQYGEAVSKKRVRPGRELFRETHIDPKQCPEWWDLFNFVP